MIGHDVIVIGASAGGVDALSEVVSGLPADLPAAVFVVLHVPPHGASLLPQILSRKGPLPATHPRDRAPIENGRIYVAPPDVHLLIRPGRVMLSRGPRESGMRPAVDPLFRSAARYYGPRVVGVVLSGSLDDGSAGLVAVKERGGVAVVQDPDDALYRGMPRSALEATTVDHCVPLAEVPALLHRLATDPVTTAVPERPPDAMEMETDMAEFDLGTIEAKDRPASPSGFACPDCGGVLWELPRAEMVRFRCRVGHAWTANSLLAQQTDSVEMALWSALRALEERAALTERMIERLGRNGANPRSARRFEGQAREARERAAIIRRLILSMEPTNVEPTAEEASDGPVEEASSPDG